MPSRILLLSLTFIEFLRIQPTRAQISCYQCNVDSSINQLSSDCTDPYVPSPLDHLLPCPENEPQHCLKATIFYNNHDLTVRACIPSRVLNSYCSADNFEASYPGAEISCYYCEEDACNHSTPRLKPFGDLALSLLGVIVANSRFVITIGWYEL